MNTEPIAWLVEGLDLDGTLCAKLLHFTLTEARTTASEFTKHYPVVRYEPLTRMTANKETTND